MPDPQTSNLQLYIPPNGADVGTWDVPVNANWNQIDAALAANNSVGLTNVPVTLSPTQYNNALLTFTGTLTGNVVVTFPAYSRIYRLFNNCGAATTFTVRAQISSASAYVALPPGEVITIAADGSNMRFVGLGRIGTYLDFATGTVPLWMTGSNPAPYLNCDGTSFSSATYPALRDYLGGTTLPDARGRFRASLNQGTGRLTGAPATNGLDGSTLLSAGGNQSIGAGNLGPDVPGALSVKYNQANATVGAGGSFTYVPNIDSTGSITSNSGSVAGPAMVGNGYAPPSYVGGLTLIRAG